MKRIQILPMAAFVTILLLASCSDDDAAGVNDNEPGQVTAEANVEAQGDYNFNSTAKQIQLSGTSATSDDSSVTTENNRVTITQSGTYHVTGTLSNGQLAVDADMEDQVKIILDGVSITSNSGAAIDIQNADKVIINLQAGTTNTLSDSGSNSQSAALYSETKLSIFGGGTLNINGNHASAIDSEGGIILRDGTINFNAQTDAVASDFNITVFSGDFTINAGEDGFDAGTDIVVNNGEINIVQSQDGFEASAVNILDGNIRVSATSAGFNTDGESTSLATQLHVADGYVYVNASGNGFNSNGNITVDGGTVIIEGPNGNDNAAITTDASFTINGGMFVAVNGTADNDAPAAASAQNSLVINFDTQQQANTVVHLQSTTGAEIVTFRPSTNFSTMVVSTASISDNGSFQLYTGGTVTGNILDGLFDFISYVGGTLQATFTVTSAVTVVNADPA